MYVCVWARYGIRVEVSPWSLLPLSTFTWDGTQVYRTLWQSLLPDISPPPNIFNANIKFYNILAGIFFVSMSSQPGWKNSTRLYNILAFYTKLNAQKESCKRNT